MCAKCVDAVRETFPELTDKEQVEILWENTSFPFGSPEYVIQQLQEHKEATQ